MTGFYVSVKDDRQRTGLLVGPLPTLGDAEAAVPGVRAWCIKNDPWNYFLAYGTTRLEGSQLPDGVLNQRITVGDVWRLGQ